MIMPVERPMSKGDKVLLYTILYSRDMLGEQNPVITESTVKNNIL